MISVNLKIFLFIVTLIYFLIVLRAVRRENMPIKSSIIWFFIGLLMLILLLFPELLVKFSSLVGIKTISNLVLFAAIMVLLVFAFDLYKINSIEKKKNIALAQEIGIIKHELNKRK